MIVASKDVLSMGTEGETVRELREGRDGKERVNIRN